MVIIIPFYSHKKNNIDDIYKCFSNFYITQPYEYELPSFVYNSLLPKKITCNCSEKAIMACKASLMNDIDTFYKIITSNEPNTIKNYGRQVKNFDDKKWLEFVDYIAYDTVYQKFKKNIYLQKILLSTKDAILVEAALKDKLWGVGIHIDDNDIYDIEKWKGKNLLGNTLMEVRKQLIAELDIEGDKKLEIYLNKKYL